ncbi:RecX family transcriptional regulator [Terrabacter sp. BE26]|uniref:regulatory protein RecX n=1 Tax=Terrabacter sp. BE26 TaxID=2898152 RepID=UPI0035BE59AD
MGFSEQETMQDRLARAAAALAEAEVVARARAGGSSGPTVSGTPDPGGPSPAPQSVGCGPPRPDVATPSDGASRRSRPAAGGAGAPPAGRARQSRQSRPKGLATGWGAEDPGERPDWAPPPEDVEAAVPDADAESVARAIALRQLSMAPRSRSQLEKKLRQRGCDDDVAARVLDRLTEVGLIDDEAYAQMLVRSKQAGKGLARKALSHELRKQGIDQEIADEALGQVGAGDERARAELLVQKKLRTMRGLDSGVQARRLAGMLARKGYPGEVAWPVIRDAIDGLPEHQRD